MTDYADLIARLRPPNWPSQTRAADAIESLIRERDTLRNVLRELVACDDLEREAKNSATAEDHMRRHKPAWDAARAALKDAL